MMRLLLLIGIYLTIALQDCTAQDSIKRLSTASDSCTCWTSEDVRKSNRIYDDRDACYAHFLEAVRVSGVWQDLYSDLQGKNKQLEKLKEQYRIDEASYEEFIELSVDELNTLSKKLNRLQKKINRRNTWLYVLGSVVVVETAIIAVVVVVP
ncbi:MAG: hypothetical protein ACPG5W_02700 [Flavobacteriales bacterium]